MLFILISLVSAIEYSRIPATGNPPSKTTASSAVYDPLYNRVITFGGFNYQLNSISSDLKTFDLQKHVWGEITPHSKLFPPGLESTYLYLRNDRKLFVFFGSGTEGISNEIFCFNLNSSIWTVQETTGDTIEGRDHYAFTSFEYEGNSYAAIFGGLTSLGLEKDLYL